MLAKLRALLAGSAENALRDAAIVGAGVLIVRGAALIYDPAGWIVAGLLVLAGVWLSDRRA